MRLHDRWHWTISRTSFLGVSMAWLCLIAMPTWASADGWGTIKGKVVWDASELPDASDEDVPPTHQDHAHCVKGGKIRKQDISVDAPTKGVNNVFVYLKKAPAIHPDLPQTKDDVSAVFEKEFEKNNGFKPTGDDLVTALGTGKVKLKDLKAPVVIDQVYCKYIPDAIALREGQKILVKNPEPINHNVNVSGFKNMTNVNMPPNTADFLDLVPDLAVTPVACNVHGWMKMYIMIFDHPYFAVSAKDGSFEIKNVPAGELTLVVRNCNGKYINRNLTVTVEAGKTTDLGAIPWAGR